jgi:hypothetical protein
MQCYVTKGGGASDVATEEKRKGRHLDEVPLPPSLLPRKPTYRQVLQTQSPLLARTAWFLGFWHLLLLLKRARSGLYPSSTMYLSTIEAFRSGDEACGFFEGWFMWPLLENRPELRGCTLGGAVGEVEDWKRGRA